MALSKIKTNSIANDAITSEKLAAGGIATVDMADGSVTSLKILDGAIATADIADGAITTAKIADGAVATVDIASNAITTPKIADTSITSAKMANSGAELGMRNRLINGDMRIAQRTTNVQTLSTGVDCYPADRWNAYGSQSSKISTVQQGSAPPPGFQTYTLVTSLSAFTPASNDTMGLGQAIEAGNISDFNFGTANAKTLTLSFWVKSSLTGTHSGVMINYAATRSYPFTYTISASNTWEYKTVTIPGDTGGTWVLSGTGGGCKILFDMGSGSTYRGPAGAWAGTYYNGVTGAVSVNGTNGATWQVTGVQLEVGSSASAFEYRQMATEMSLCQRYYFTTATATQYMGGISFSANRVLASVHFPVNMRVAPTAVQSSSQGYFFTNGSANTINGYGITGTAHGNVWLDLTVTLAAGIPGVAALPSPFQLVAEL